jgi:hypothetical protein
MLMSIRWLPLPILTLSAVSAVLAIAHGGGSEDAAPLSTLAATQYAANASLVGADASSALDATLLTATQLVPGTASRLGVQRKQAPAASGVGLACPGGGTALTTISGADSLEERNGQLDAGEVYQLAFLDCRGAGGQAALNGAVTMTVVSAVPGSTAVTFSTTTLNATLPRGAISFIGSAGVQRSSSVTGVGSNVTTRVTAASLAVTTEFNGRIGNFTLSDVDLTRQASYSAGALIASSHAGSHKLAGTVPGVPFEYSVVTEGRASFSASGAPIQGGWVVTLPHRSIAITLANAIVTIAIDEGENGNLGRSFTLPLESFGEAAG